MKEIFYKYLSAKTLGFLAILLVANCLSLEVEAQQDARFSQYMFNGLVLNPGYTGSVEGTSINAFYRNQWVNIEGAPQTYSLSGHGRVTERMGLGAYIQHDRIGVHNNSDLYLTYSYSIPFSFGRLAAGVNAGANYYVANFTDVEPGQGSAVPDPVFSQNETKIMPNVGAGLYFYSDYFYLGVSAPHLVNNKLVGLNARQYRHYYATAGGVLAFTDDIKLTPSVLFKTVPVVSPFQFDFNLNLTFLDTFWIGGSYRTNEQSFSAESVVGLIGFMLNNGMRIGYAYDYTLTDLQNYTTGSHEITIGWDLRKDNDRIISPRYF